MKRRAVWSNTARDEHFAIRRHIAEESPGAVERMIGSNEKVLHSLPYVLTYRQSQW